LHGGEPGLSSRDVGRTSGLVGRQPRPRAAVSRTPPCIHHRSKGSQHDGDNAVAVPYSLPQQLQSTAPVPAVPGAAVPAVPAPAPAPADAAAGAAISFGTQQQFQAPHGGQQYQVTRATRRSSCRFAAALPELLASSTRASTARVSPRSSPSRTPRPWASARDQQWAGGSSRPRTPAVRPAAVGASHTPAAVRAAAVRQRPTVW